MYKPNAPLKIEPIRFPEPGRDEVLVRIKGSGICSSDLHALRGKLPTARLPLVLGHEGAGVIESCGANVNSHKVGERVMIDYVFACENCPYCLSGRRNLCSNVKLFGFDVDGSFAEYAVINARNVVSLPEQIPYDQGAILGCAVSTPYHAIRIADLTKDQTVAIFGIGGMGYHAALLCKTMGEQRSSVSSHRHFTRKPSER